MEALYDDYGMYRAGHKVADEISIMALHGLEGDWQNILPG